MKTTKLEQKLWKAARRQPPDERVPFAFEKRIMARLAAVPAVDRWADWGRALWRAAIPCVGVAILLGVWTMAPLHPGEPLEDLSLEFESTVFAGMHPHIEDTW